MRSQRGRSCRWIANRFRTPFRDERSYAAARHKIKVRCMGKVYGKILLVPSSLMRITAKSRLSFTYLTITWSSGTVSSSEVCVVKLLVGLRRRHRKDCVPVRQRMGRVQVWDLSTHQVSRNLIVSIASSTNSNRHQLNRVALLANACEGSRTQGV